MSEIYTSGTLLTMVRSGLRDIGYQDSLLKQEYSFVDVFTDDSKIRTVDIAAFAQEPPSYRNACFGVVISPHDEPDAVMEYMALGAPQIFTLHPETQKVCRWTFRSKEKPILMECIEPDQLEATIVAHKDVWNPEKVLRAKSIGFGKANFQLDFFDAGLIPTLEKFVYAKLNKLLIDTIASSELAYIEYGEEDLDDKVYKALFRLIFRLIAAKLLGDRGYPGNWLSNDAQQVIKEVENFYSMSSGDVLNNANVQDVAWRKIRNAFSFQNLSVEALAYVYENTFVSAQTRKSYGTHATDHSIAEYVLQNLPIEDIDRNERYIFEPFAGHAPFLIAALEKLRSLLPSDTTVKQRHNYLVRMLAGMEVDAFACEVARYSLILADYPNPNGWLIENENVFASSKLDRYLRRAQVVLCNPPYEDFAFDDLERGLSIYSPNRAVEALDRILSFKPKMLGFVLPRTFIDGKMYLRARKQIAELYDNVSLIGLPDNAFHYSEAETVLLIAHGQRTARPTWSSAFVKKADFEEFIHTGKPTWQAKAPDSFIEQELHSPIPNFWYTPMHLIWEALAHLPRFEEIADIHRGIEHNVPFKENKHNIISNEPKDGFAPGLTRVTDGFEPYITQSFSYLNIEPRMIHPRTKAHLWPWDEPKVITNAVRLSRGPWTIAATIDDKGLVCMQNFHGIWSLGKYPLEVIAALLNGPVANAFLSTHNTTKHNKLGTTKQIPIPNLRPSQIRLIVSLVRQYMSCREQWQTHPNHSQRFERLCKGIMEQIDAEILAAYDLAPHLEQQLLEHFGDFPKPGPVAVSQPKPSPLKRLYTSLIKIENIGEDNNSKFIEAVIINWNPHQTVRLPISLVPDNIKEKLDRDVWLLAQVNVGARKAEDLFFENIELAPEPHVNDRLA